jgi:multidrug efflux pump subunit AcrA (membrane-fusion protein)
VNNYKYLYAFLILVTLTGCGGKKDNSMGGPTIPVSATKASNDVVLEKLNFVGDIKAKEEVTLFSKVTGKLVDYKVNESDRVKREQVVAMADRNEVGFKFQEAPVLSTIDGVVGRTYLDVGADIQLNTPIALIVNMDEVRVRVSVVEKHLPKVRINQEAHIYVDAYPDKTFTGKVTKRSPVVDLKTRTAPIEITVPNSNQELLPGMFAKVEIIINRFEDAIIVPEESIVTTVGKTLVYTVSEGKASLKDVQLGIREKGRVQVLSGLKGNETVVIGGHQKVRDGSLVSIKE